MPHFDENGHDTYICQVCAKIKSSAKSTPEWRPDITNNKSAANVCEDCVKKHDTNEYFDVRTHNGTITITNKETEGHRTFRIKTEKWCNKRVIRLLNGPDNENNYKAFAFANDNGVKVWDSRKNQGHWDKYADMLARPEVYKTKCEYLYSGRCRKCNRKLTVPESIKLGIGPVCGGRS